MSGFTVYPRDRQRECARQGHWFMPRLVRPISAATTLPSEWRDVCVTCGVAR